ncbi:MAG: family 43 glycosylhydrolase [Bacteroidaceae bacterium]|nr:family 43 glycosylhydrolase [Bacteroidaceae bacterium]
MYIKTLTRLTLGAVAVSAAFFSAQPLVAQTQLTPAQMQAMRNTVSHSDVGVHDPSVVFDRSTSTYYIIGSHLDVAKTTNLADWTRVATGSEHSSFLASSYATAFSSNPEHAVSVRRGGTVVTDTLGSFDAGAFCATYSQVHVNDSKVHSPMSQSQWISGNMWAPDIIYNPHMGKWCMYLSLNGDNWASVIVLLTASSPTGPYTYEAPIVFGGFNGQSYTQGGTTRSVDYRLTDLELVLGRQSSLPSRYRTGSWGTYYPNCIDPCVFFDEEGELWMSYGSWSGGIYMLKLDRNTGLRDYTVTYPGTGTSPNAAATSDAYFGKKIAGGYYVSGEGSYIQRIGDYYYLFMSYGFYSPEGGYEMRVFRSSSPDGPYVDGNGVSALFTSYVLNYGPSAATNRGMKLMGAMNGWGRMSVGECAQGHNSAIVDTEGNAFLVCHTKFNNGTVMHQVRVHQLFQNERGWLVAAPFRHTAVETTQSQIDTTRLFTADEVAGTYSMLVHSYRLDHKNHAEALPVKVHLSADGRVSGDTSGTWEFTRDGQSYVKIVLSGTTYYGVVCRQTVHGYSAMKARCITVVSDGGVPVWLYRYEPQSALADSYEGVRSFLSGTIMADAPSFDNVSVVYTADDSVALLADGRFAFTDDGHSISVTATASSDGYFYTLSGNPLTAQRGDIESGLQAYYRLNSLTSVNECNASQRLTTGCVASGHLPDIANDAQRGSVFRQYFGAQSAASYGRVPNPLYGTDATSFSVAFWVKRLDSDGWDALVGFFGGDTPTASGGRCYLTGNAYFGYNDNSGHWFDINYPSTAYSDIPTGRWAFVTLTATADGPRLFVDGVERPFHSWNANDGTASSAFDYASMVSAVTSYAYLYIGAGSWWGSAPAYVSDLAVYSRALSTSDVAYLYSRMQGTEPLVTGIAPAHADRPCTDAAYTLDGRPAAPDHRGVVVVGGRKLLRR